jgi:hypothetical protein
VDGKGEEEEEEEEVGLWEDVPGSDRRSIAMRNQPEKEDRGDQRNGDSRGESIDAEMGWRTRAGGSMGVSYEARNILLFISEVISVNCRVRLTILYMERNCRFTAHAQTPVARLAVNSVQMPLTTHLTRK